MKSTWKKIWKVLRSVIGWWALGIITLVIVLNLYTLPWTGFGDYTTATGDFMRGKTLWDWMQLLIIPLFLAVGVIALNRSEKNRENQLAEDRARLERNIARDRQQEAALQSYLDRMSDLLLKEKLLTTRTKEVRNVARTRTLTVLRGLDEKRKGLVVLFLHEAGLLAKKKVIDLSGADLSSANLNETELSGVNLSMTYLESADFRNAFLEEAIFEKANLLAADFSNAFLSNASLAFADLAFAYLTEADLTGAILRFADIAGADLSRTQLAGADLSQAYLIGHDDIPNANLEGANLDGANLTGAKIAKEQLASARSLKGATMPDGTKHD